MKRPNARGVLVIGVATFIAVGLLLEFVAGLPAWASIVIPAFAVGAFAGVAQR